MTSTIHESNSGYHSNVPVLYSGDALDRAEFLRRYEAAGENVWAERINGKVYLMPPLRAVQHGNPHALLSGWLFNYAMSDPQLTLSDNATIFLGTEHDPQPDLCLYRENRNTHVENGYLVGPPELIVEVAGSSASYDFGEKKDVYEQAGVNEYLVFETVQGVITWWENVNSKFVEVNASDGVFRSRLFPGLWLDAEALRSADANRVIETLRRGMASV